METSLNPEQWRNIQYDVDVSYIKEDLLKELGSGSVTTDVAIRTLKNLERKENIKAFFTKPVVLVLTSLFLFSVSIAIPLVAAGTVLVSLTTLPLFVKIACILMRIVSFGFSISSLYFLDGCDTFVHATKAREAHHLIEKLQFRIKEDFDDDMFRLIRNDEQNDEQSESSFRRRTLFNGNYILESGT